MKRLTAPLVILMMFLAFFESTPVLGASSSPSQDGPICFSLVPKKNVDHQITELQPLLDLLEKRLNRQIKVIRPQSYHSVIEGILSRTIDFAILGPASYAKARARDNQVEAFASFASKKGFITPRGSFYYSVLFTVKDNRYDTWEDLKGKKIAFTDPASTSGSVIPSIYFSKEIGEALNEFFGSHIYTGSHDRSIKSVKKGYADGAFVSSARIDEAIEKGSLEPDQVIVLWQSKPIHSDPFVFRGGLDPSLKDQIRSVMLSSLPELDAMFKNMQMLGIEAVSDSDYQAIHEIIARKAQ
ncbi:MAG: phosphate/phosphite/phosphonate ABC transporter substrate-binding protein [Desulfobacteraceae bacterium]|nr:MAG: phosphate/phosphite/phosphonate ABC transporter substrate-binding protein [Desulfobacteraceae bacterium]